MDISSSYGHKFNGAASFSKSRIGDQQFLEHPKDKVSIREQDDHDLSADLRNMQREIIRTQSAASVEQTSSSSDSGKSIKIGTYNVEWLGCEKAAGLKPRTDKDYEDIASIIKESGADAMGLEEVGSEDALKKLMKNLPGFDYIIGTTGTRDGGKSQHVAIIYNADRIQCDKSSMEEIREVMVPDLAGEGRLRAPVAVRMKAGDFDFTLVVCHLKARFDEESIKIRNAQTEVMNDWIAKRTAADGDKDVIVVGDFNDFVDSIALGKFDNQLYFVTKEAKERGLYSTMRYKSIIDHIGVTSGPGGSNEEYIKGSVSIPDLRRYPNYVKRISDHKPVIASFKTEKS